MMKFKNYLFYWHCEPSKAVARTYSVILILIIAFGIINTKLLQLAMTPGLENNNSSFISYYRKDIVDRNGSLIATSIPTYSLFAHPDLIYNKKQAATKLSKIIKAGGQKKLLNKLQSSHKFTWLARNLNPSQVQQVNELGIPGVDFDTSFKRIYSYGNLLSHILGYVSIDNKGLAGIERFFDNSLLSDHKNNNKHHPLQLSVDVGIQNIVSEELDSAIKEFNASGGVGVVVDPNNGEILSLVSKPDFNPHNPGKAKAKQLFNKSSLGVYEFGSVFKILTMAIAMETRAVKHLNQKYDISHLKVGKFEISDYTPSQGLHSVAEIFAKSSNKGTGKIALDIGQADFKKYLQKLKLDKKSFAEIPETTTPLLPNTKKWSDISTVTISYGYGIATNVLNLIQSILPTVNGGIFYPLTLVKQDSQVCGERIFSERTSKNIQHLLRLVVTNGTGRKADVEGYLVGGKSGTANKAQGKQYNKNSRIANFVSIFPYTNPKYLVYVMLDDPKPTKVHRTVTGGASAAIATSKIISRIVAFQGILPYDDEKELPSGGIKLTSLN
ncbi:hypothetical protein phytr_5820 [Candidatus Phycorickettsia trachydisci]|uniref:Cell division protein FtsI n=1 Tax=Candidatus Phycorickettsia trachydisci TaxID=2115978 RepID=A0A2P1P8F0_9RICK|nr:penicillin-binding protein 2 [Candidatus Phycorickettsia trachydisci]AVP87525.1 hypothetical protein phytr_5820 [Candidatus Phycorickettsia trachydisci]